jgi:hypothetical protein
MPHFFSVGWNHKERQEHEDISVFLVSFVAHSLVSDSLLFPFSLLCRRCRPRGWNRSPSGGPRGLSKVARNTSRSDAPPVTRVAGPKRPSAIIARFPGSEVLHRYGGKGSPSPPGGSSRMARAVRGIRPFGYVGRRANGRRVWCARVCAHRGGWDFPPWITLPFTGVGTRTRRTC